MGKLTERLTAYEARKIDSDIRKWDQIDSENFRREQILDRYIEESNISSYFAEAASYLLSKGYKVNPNLIKGWDYNFKGGDLNTKEDTISYKYLRMIWGQKSYSLSSYNYLEVMFSLNGTMMFQPTLIEGGIIFSRLKHVPRKTLSRNTWLHNPDAVEEAFAEAIIHYQVSSTNDEGGISY